MSKSLVSPVTFLDGITASTTSFWYATDFRWNGGAQARIFAGTLTAGDSIFIEASPDYPANVTSTAIVTVATFTATPFAVVVDGPWPSLRVRKSGTNGAATVKGVV